jgi:rRNA maturation endonuclease Nob1
MVAANISILGNTAISVFLLSFIIATIEYIIDFYKDKIIEKYGKQHTCPKCSEEFFETDPTFCPFCGFKFKRKESLKKQKKEN